MASTWNPRPPGPAPAVARPPCAAARSLMPASPSPVVPSGPCPSSVTVTVSSAGVCVSSTVTLLARACLTTFVSASCTIR